MNFSASEVQEDLKSLKDKLEEGVSIDDLLSIVDLPILSEFSQAAGGLLPVNLVKVGADGKVDLLSLTELQQALSKGLGNIKDYLEGEVLGLFNALKGEVEAVYDQAKEVYEELSNLGDSLKKDNSVVFDAAISALNGATGLNINAQSLATLKQAGENAMKNLSDLSPKQIKDLANPDFFGKIVNTTLDTAIAVTGVAAEVMGEQSISNSQLGESSYMDLFRQSNSQREDVSESDDGTISIVVYRQVYWASGEGATPEAAAKKSSWNGATLKDNYSLAVDNTNILIGDKITFPDETKSREKALDTRSKALKDLGAALERDAANPDLANSPDYQSQLALYNQELNRNPEDLQSVKEREAVDIATRSKGLSITGSYPVVAIFFDKREDALEYRRKYSKYATATIKRGSNQNFSKRKSISSAQLSPNVTEQQRFLQGLIDEERAALKALDRPAMRRLEEYAQNGIKPS